MHSPPLTSLLVLALALARSARAVPIFGGGLAGGLGSYDYDYDAASDESLVFRDIGITPKEIQEIREFEEEFDLNLLDDVLDIINESAREL